MRVILLSFLFYNCSLMFSQSNKNTFDITLTAKNKFLSSKDLAEKFLYYILSVDSSNYELFYSKEIECLLIDEEKKHGESRPNVDYSEFCKDEIINKVFQGAIIKKRRAFFSSEGKIDFSDIKIIGIKQIKSPEKLNSNYNYELFNIYLEFKNKKINKNYKLSIFDVYHINYKWFILDPDFEIE